MAHYIKLSATFIAIFLHITQLNARAADEDQFVLIEGDMIVEKGFLENARTKRGAILKKRQSKHSYRWPATISDSNRIVRIPYILKAGLFSGSGLKKAFRQAIDEYHKRTCLRFEEKTDSDKDYIEIISGTGCWSQIGRRGGTQQLSLGSGCESKGRGIHELMHAIGFLHEQSRKDRDQHVRILYGNIEAGKVSQFKKYKQDTGNLPYDFHSIMHYGNTFFSKNNKPTVEAIIDPKIVLGLEQSFSALDVVRINMLYQCPQLQTNLLLYFVTVVTADASFAGTDSKVDILLNGGKGDSGEVELGATKEVPDPFEKGSTITFPVISPDIGSFKSLRIRLEGSSWFNWWYPNAWNLKRVEIEPPDYRKTKKKIVLNYNKWIYPGDHVKMTEQG